MNRTKEGQLDFDGTHISTQLVLVREGPSR